MGCTAARREVAAALGGKERRAAVAQKAVARGSGKMREARRCEEEREAGVRAGI